MKTPTKGEDDRQVVPAKHHEPSDMRVAAAPAASSIPSVAPARDAAWAAEARRHAVTAERRRVVDVLARSDGRRRTLGQLAHEAGVARDTVRRTVTILEGAKLLERTTATAASLGFTGYTWTLFEAPRPLQHRDGYGDRALATPALPTCNTGMDTGFAGGATPAPCVLTPSERIDAKDEVLSEQAQEDVQHDRRAKIVAGLERKHGQVIRRGRNRELLFESLRENEDGVRACYEDALERGDSPLGLLFTMLQDGEHLVRAKGPDPVARPECSCADSLTLACHECSEYTTRQLQVTQEVRP